MQKFCILFVAALTLLGCKENIDTSARYVFKYETVMSYLQKHEAYSEYVKLIELVPISSVSGSTVAQLLAARGRYTVFAPTNEAIAEYLQTVYEENPDLMSGPTWDDFFTEHKRDSIRLAIVHNSIIDSGDHEDYYEICNFPTTDYAEFPLSNLMDHKLSVHYPKDAPDSIYINGDCPVSIKQRDILCLNGVIHQVEKAVVPKDITAASYILDLLDKKKEGFLVMSKVVQACGLLDTLSKIRDEVYESLYQRNLIPNLVGMTNYGFAEGSTGYAPKHRLYGFTIFSETDEYWRSQGLDPQEPSATLLPKLQNWIYSNKQYSEEYDKFNVDENYTSPDNLLYQWITYHILPMRMPTDRLVFHISENGYIRSNPYNYGIPVYEYYSTFGKRRLIKLFESKESNGVYINRFPKLDNGRRGTNHEISCDEDKVGNRVGKDSEMAIVNDIVNCCIYPIDKPLAYTDQVRNNLGKERIRFDGMSLFPEAMNNEIRLKRGTEERYVHVYIPNTVTTYDYFHDMQMNEQTNFVYYNTAYTETWCNLHTNEMKAVGRFEIMFTLPPVPRRGTYEFRYCVLANGNRGVQQIYFGSDPSNLPVAGIPLDLTMPSNHPLFGREEDTDDDDYNAEVDKRMRNNSVMKGTRSVTAGGSSSSTERDQSHRENVRRIMWRGTLDPDKTYYMKVKSVLDSDRKEFYMDYMEYCPKEVYDNPETPEDIW
jgi:hypothetical protein